MRTPLQRLLESGLKRVGADDGAAPPRAGLRHSWGLGAAPASGGGPLRLPGPPRGGRLGGDLCAFDRRQNEITPRDGYEILSSYETPAGKVWIITEADRSVTTILLPEEY